MSNHKRARSVMKFGDGLQISDQIQEALSKAECSICLPYELSIIEIDRILSAIRHIGGASNSVIKLSKGADKWVISSPSAFDIWEFIFDRVYELPTAICTLVHEPTDSAVFWDDDERFVVIAGSKTFCETAFPHRRDVLEHFYIQSTINDFEDEKILKECFAKLTSGK